MIQYNYPFKIDGKGHTAITNEQEHIYQLIEQVLFTDLGERVNHPTFGTGIRQLVFAPNNNELAIATKFLIQGALQQWLGDLITVTSVEVNSDESMLNVTIKYVLLKNQLHDVAEFKRTV